MTTWVRTGLMGNKVTTQLWFFTFIALPRERQSSLSQKCILIIAIRSWRNQVLLDWLRNSWGSVSENAKVKDNGHTEEQFQMWNIYLSQSHSLREEKRDHLVTIGYRQYVYVDNNKQQCDVTFFGARWEQRCNGWLITRLNLKAPSLEKNKNGKWRIPTATASASWNEVWSL